MADTESPMIETATGIEDVGFGHMAEDGAVTCPASRMDADTAMTCPAAHLDELRPSDLTFCSSNNPYEYPSEYPDDNDSTLLPCTICNRTFNPQALERHRKVCEKLSSKRRKTFSSTKQRVDGLDLPPSLPIRGKSPETKAQQTKSKSKWREKHQEFLRAIRAAKGMEDDEVGGEGHPASNIPSDYVQCPQCERHFGPKAADRHIEWCKEKATRMPRSPANTQAAQRLKTRTKYAPPKPGQNGWRAPKKSDVISSIPPPSSGPTPTPGGPLGAREFSPPANRHISPPRSLARQTSPPLPTGRHMSPPPMTSSRRTSISSVASLGRSGSMSLGRSAGKQLSAALSSVSAQNSVYGSSPSYGTSSGYGQSSKYGQSQRYGQQHQSGQGSSLSRMQVGRSSFSGGPLPMVRQGSTRSSLRRTSSSTPMARLRDLTSDMMASVCITPDPKRGEPEGDEASEIFPTCSSSMEASYSNKIEKEKINKIKKRAHVIHYNVREKYDKIVENSDNEDEADAQSERTRMNTNIERENHKNTSDVGEKGEWCRNEGPYDVIALACDNKSVNHKDASRTDHPNDFDDESDNEILDELKYNYESEEEIDIPTEENFLKSSTSISGDDEALEQMNFGRPRSVHFEDELWENGEYKIKYDTDIQQVDSKEGMQNFQKQEAHVYGRLYQGDSASSESLLSKQGRLSNVKSANKESVREILRRKREEAGEILEQDDRRRVAMSVDRLYGGSCENLFEGRGRSKSGDSPQNDFVSEHRSSENLSKKSISAKYCLESGRNQRKSRSRSPKKGLVTAKEDMAFIPFNGSQSSAGVIISRRDYAMFRALAEKHNKTSERMERGHHKKSGKTKRSNFSKSGIQKRPEDVAYDPFSAAELQMQALMGFSKPTSRKGSGLGAAGLGLGISMMESVGMEESGRDSPDFDFDIGLEEFEKEYQSTKTPSYDYDFSKSRIRKDSESSEIGMKNRIGSLSGLTQEPVVGSPVPNRALDSDWPWKIDPSSLSDHWSVGALSPKLKKSSWGTARDSRRNNQNLLSSVSQENISDDIPRSPSPAFKSTRESRSWSSPSRDTNWLRLTDDINNWSASVQGNHDQSAFGNDSLSLPSCDSPRKTSPVRETRYSPDRSSLGWASPIHDSQSTSYNTNKFSLSTSDSLSESSALRDTNEAHGRISRNYNSYRLSPSRDKENSLSSHRKEISPSRDSPRLSSSPQRSVKDYSYGYDTHRWSSPPRERLNDLSSTRNTLLDIFDNKKESSTFHETPSFKTAIDDKQKNLSTGKDISNESTTQDKQYVSSSISRLGSQNRYSASAVPSSGKWASSTQDEGDDVKTSSNSRGEIGWSTGDSSSGVSSLSRYQGGGSISGQSSVLMAASDEGYKKKSGFETFRTTHDSMDGDMNSAKKGTSGVEDSLPRVSSGSSSDSSSLPPLSSPILSTANAGNTIGDCISSTSAMKMPRFCHECGHKYPVLLAKFCCHCGSRRASLENKN